MLMPQTRPNVQWPQAFKRRRILWLSAIEPRAQPRYHLLDLDNDVLLHIFRMLLPQGSVLRGRALASYRDATHFAFTCRRLARLFIKARERPVAVDAAHQPQLSPVAEPRFFRSVIGDTSSVLRELHLPPFPMSEISGLVLHILTAVPTLGALQLTDDGSISSEIGKALATSSIRTLHVLKPRSNCVNAFSHQEERVFTASFRGICNDLLSQAFLDVKEINMRGTKTVTIMLRDSSRVGLTNLLIKPHKDSPDFRFFPIFRAMLGKRLRSDFDGVIHTSSLVMHRTRRPQPELYIEIQAPTARDLQYFLHPPNYLQRFNSAAGVLTLDLPSITEVNSFLSADQRTKTRARYRTRATSTLSHIRAGFLLGNEDSFCKLCKCLLTLLSSRNSVNTLEVSREFVAFANSRAVPRLLKRVKNLKMVSLRNPTINDHSEIPPSSIVSDHLFLERLPTFIDHLEENCEQLETITMGLCFPQYPFERRRDLRPGIITALNRLLQYEKSSLKVDIDGLRRQLLRWLERVDLDH
ncbi:hypothetical protein FGB62_23g04 [Gracilaria domingensis]|nr:hypothetical protein FGB62_23g04 [Gracilaria domingensis]